jgi:hypothetical protein
VNTIFDTILTPSELIQELFVVAGIRSVEHLTETKTSGRLRKEVKTSHGFRKFVHTNITRTKIDKEAREMLLGHSIGLSDSYYRPDANEILQEYLKAVDLLTINEENRLHRQIETQRIEHTAERERMRMMVDEIRQKMGLDTRLKSRTLTPLDKTES